MSEALAEILRNGVGLLGLALVVAGVWGSFGWPAAAVTAGLPLSAFYIWGQAQAMRDQKGGG